MDVLIRIVLPRISSAMKAFWGENNIFQFICEIKYKLIYFGQFVII